MLRNERKLLLCYMRKSEGQIGLYGLIRDISAGSKYSRVEGSHGPVQTVYSCGMIRTFLALVDRK